MALSPGPFGPFVLLEPVGRGGMGEVWLARPRSGATVLGLGAGELCVLKTMRTDVAEDHDAVKRFGDEARLALLLAHPRIGRVLDAGRIGGIRYMALELVEGIDVLTLLRRCAETGRTVDEAVALWIAACALDALSFAHGALHPVSKAPLGIVHRDISPQNVMCDASGFAHVIDFGLALSSVKRAQTAQDVVMGKLSYMSPEQARGEQLDARCDIYAAGVVFYELLALEPYWGALENKEIWGLVGRPDYKPPRFGSLPPDVAQWLAPLIDRDPKKRAADAAAARNALGPLLNARGGGPSAQKRLAALVEELGAEELARIRRLRTATSAPAPVDDLVAGGAADETIAVAEADAIRAAIATKTQQLPALPPLTDSEPIPLDVVKPKQEPIPLTNVISHGPAGGAPRDTLQLPASELPALASSPRTPAPAPTSPTPAPRAPPAVREVKPAAAAAPKREVTGTRAAPPAASHALVYVVAGGVVAVFLVVVLLVVFRP